MLSKPEVNGHSGKSVGLESIENRFGIIIGDGEVKRGEMLPLIFPANQLVVAGGVPERRLHQPYWEWHMQLDNEGVDVRLKDQISLYRNTDLAIEMIEPVKKELQLAEIDGVGEQTPKLQELKKMIDGRSGNEWIMGTDYQLAGSIDYYSPDNIRIMLSDGKDDNPTGVVFDVWYTGVYKISIPVDGEFDERVKTAQSMMDVFSDWMEMDYSPQLKYEFAMAKDSEVEKPSFVSRDWKEYFHKVVDAWDVYPKPLTVRALLGWGADKSSPIMMMEDVHASVGVMSLADGWMPKRTLLVSSHPEIWSAFEFARRSGFVSDELVNDFPEGEFDDREWLHMFVDFDENGDVVVREDVASNNGKEEIGHDEIVGAMEKKYSIRYGGSIDRKLAERRAKTPMIMPLIDVQVARVEKLYGSSAANKFRGVAISWLINESLHAKSVYDAYEKLINYSGEVV